MYQSGQTENICREMLKAKIDILAITESRWTKNGEFKHHSGLKILYSGHMNDDAGHNQGVALMLTKQAERAMISWQPHGPRIMEAYFKTSDKNISLRIIVAYAPTEQANTDVKNEFYDQLDSVYKNGHKGRDLTMLLGDFNAQVGSNNENVEEVMGIYGLGLRNDKENDNGDRLVSFCTENKLVIGGTIFKHKKIHTATWKSPDQRTFNQIDHICISRRFKGSLLDVRVQRGPDVNSDHYLLTSKVRLRFKKQDTICNPRKKYNITTLQNSEKLLEFKLDLQNRFEVLAPSDEDGVEEVWQGIKKVYTDTSQEKLGFKKANQKPWVTQRSLDLMDQRRELRQKTLSRNSPEDNNLYKMLSRDIQRSVRNDKKEHLENLAMQAEIAANQNRLKDVYEITKSIAGKVSKSGSHIRDKDGSLLKTDEDILNRWAEHFTELLNLPPPEEEVEIPPSDPLDIDCEAPNLMEIKEAIKSLKNNKAAGPDNIPAEVIKADIDTSAKAFLPLITKIWNDELCPEDWKNGHISILAKKGDLTHCGNYRGIMLLSVPGRILSKILLNRIKKKVNEKLRPNQAGFRPNRSTIDQITTLRIIIEQSKEWNSELFVNFIDYKKAFDSLDRKSLWKICRHYGIPEKIINIIKAIYDKGGGNVMYKGKLSTFFEILTGVRQGCLLSPFLFLLAIDWIMKNCESKDGIQWCPFGKPKILGDLDFADDIALTTSNRSQMQRRTNMIAETSKKVGLEINVQKTKILRINAKSQEPISIGDQILEDVTCFEYLGSKLDEVGGTLADVKSRINKSRTAFASLTKVWNSNNISIKTKLRLFKSNVLSVLLYGAETWFLNTAVVSKLQTYVNKCLRRIHKIFWPNKISNTELLERSDMSDIKLTIKQRKWRWLGHTLRKGHDDITNQSLKWNPQGNRKVGRPKSTWKRELQNELKKEINKTLSEASTVAASKEKWKDLVRGLCST